MCQALYWVLGIKRLAKTLASNFLEYVGKGRSINHTKYKIIILVKLQRKQYNARRLCNLTMGFTSSLTLNSLLLLPTTLCLLQNSQHPNLKITLLIQLLLLSFETIMVGHYTCITVVIAGVQQHDVRLRIQRAPGSNAHFVSFYLCDPGQATRPL